MNELEILMEDYVTCEQALELKKAWLCYKM